MPEALDLDRLTRQTRQREFLDGLNELQTGMVFLLMGGMGGSLLSAGGMGLYMRSLIWNRELTILGLLALLGLCILVALGSRRVVQYLREQILWKGQGQAAPLPLQVRWPVLAAVTGITILLIGVAVMQWPAQRLDLAGVMRALAATSGIGTGLLYVAIGREVQLPRLQWVGLVGGLLSAAIYLLPLDAGGSWLALGCLWMATLAISGGLALRRRLTEMRAQHG